MSRAHHTRSLASALVLGALLSTSLASALSAPRQTAADSDVPGQAQQWTWPVDGPRVVIEPFRAPAQPWSAGHRGIDVAASLGAVVRAPADGTIAFRGVVVDRPLVTVAHQGGLVTTLEPVDSDLEPGTVVHAGAEIGTLATGGHTPNGALHLGVRWHGAYINPLLLFGGIPRAVLLPCC